MSTTPSPNAIALYRFLEREWADMGKAPTTWCRENGIPDPTVLRWRQGVEPDVRNLKRVAEALGRSFLEILLAAEYISEEEANGQVVAPRVVDAREAIRLDQTLPEAVRELMLQMLDGVNELYRSDAGGKVSYRTTQRRGRTTTERTTETRSKAKPAGRSATANGTTTQTRRSRG